MNAYPNEYARLDRAVSDEVKARIAVARGVTQASIADRLGIRRATLSVRVNGHAPFAPSLLAEIAGLLGTTAPELMAAAERRMRAAEEQENRGPNPTGEAA